MNIGVFDKISDDDVCITADGCFIYNRKNMWPGASYPIICVVLVCDDEDYAGQYTPINIGYTNAGKYYNDCVHSLDMLVLK